MKRLNFALCSLSLLAACSGSSKSSDGKSVAPAALPDLAGRWTVTMAECSPDGHLRSDLEIDLSSGALGLIGTKSETDAQTCRSVLGYLRVSTSLTGSDVARTETGKLSVGAEKVSCWKKPYKDTDSPVDETHDLPTSDISYTLVLTADHLDVQLEGWSECQSLHLEATPKK